MPVATRTTAENANVTRLVSSMPLQLFQTKLGSPAPPPRLVQAAAAPQAAAAVTASATAVHARRSPGATASSSRMSTPPPHRISSGKRLTRSVRVIAFLRRPRRPPRAQEALYPSEAQQGWAVGAGLPVAPRGR